MPNSLLMHQYALTSHIREMKTSDSSISSIGHSHDYSRITSNYRLFAAGNKSGWMQQFVVRLSKEAAWVFVQRNLDYLWMI